MVLVGSGDDSLINNEDVVSISFWKIRFSIVSNLFSYSFDLAELDMLLFERICANRAFSSSWIDGGEVDDSISDSGCFETKTCERKLAWTFFTFRL